MSGNKERFVIQREAGFDAGLTLLAMRVAFLNGFGLQKFHEVFDVGMQRAVSIDDERINPCQYDRRIRWCACHRASFLGGKRR